jgi:hypothetical protein
MRILAVSSLLLVISAFAQTPYVNLKVDLQKSLVGDWTGVLEYRDYSEPPTSTSTTMAQMK